MKKLIFTVMLLFLAASVHAKGGSDMDTIQTSEGDLTITFLGHASLILSFKESVIFVDPCGEFADYSSLGKADLILITHEHDDHCDPEAVKKIIKDGTQIICTAAAASKGSGSQIMKNGDTSNFKGIKIEAVPSYNIVQKNSAGNLFHPKGRGNGYILTFADKRIYIAGDTENIPEMKQIKNIFCAFLPMNIPYTMTPEMTADAAGMIQPQILYPYHFGSTDITKLTNLLKDSKIEVRVRNMQ